MKKNSTSKTLKAAVAVILVMVSLFAMTSVVSANFSKLIFDNEYTIANTSSGSQSDIYIRYDDNGDVYSVTFYNGDGLVETRIDYQGTPHWIDGEPRLPHQHNYTYFYGPNGEGPPRRDNPTYTNFRAW